MNTEKPRGVFLSHTHSDKEFVRRLASDIEALGLDVWFDEWELRVGDSLIGRVEEGIEGSQWMIVVISPAAIMSQWVQKELRAGLTREIGTARVFVLPVLAQKVELPEFLRDKFYADFTGSYEYGLALVKDRLLASYNARQRTRGNWLLVRTPLSWMRFRGYAISNLYYHPSDDLTAAIDLRGALQAIAHAPQSMRPFRPHNQPEVWFGNTGRLILRSDGNRVFGDYDWHGVSFAGTIDGLRTEHFIRFAWTWNGSSEQGRGVFWLNVPDILHGGWWMDYDDVDERAICTGAAQVPNRWAFANVQGLHFSSDNEDDAEPT